MLQELRSRRAEQKFYRSGRARSADRRGTFQTRLTTHAQLIDVSWTIDTASKNEQTCPAFCFAATSSCKWPRLNSHWFLSQNITTNPVNRCFKHEYCLSGVWPTNWGSSWQCSAQSLTVSWSQWYMSPMYVYHYINIFRRLLFVCRHLAIEVCPNAASCRYSSSHGKLCCGHALDFFLFFFAMHTQLIDVLLEP